MDAARIVLAIALMLALAFRASALGTYGFSEDETSKLRAIEAYQHGNLSANAEHPMLMKLAMWGSLSAADRWTRLAGERFAIAPEVALRLPNAIAGVVTVAAVFGTADLLFGPAVAAVAALLLALDPNVTAINRIGKEDTFLLMFFFLAVWCYEHAKRVGVVDVLHAKRWYTWGGVMFGLMLASKYVPHLLGLYALFNVVYLRDAGPNSPDKPRYYAAMGLAFLAANVAVLVPETWRACLAYIQGQQLTHHGTPYAGGVYVTDVPWSLRGLPVSYYARLIATKAPLLVLAGATVGLVPLIRRRRERGFTWMGVLFVPLLVSYSVIAAKYERYALPMLILLDVLAAIGIVWVIGGLTRAAGSEVRRAVGGVVCLAIVAIQVAIQIEAAPFYSLYQNALGGRLDPVSAFPEEAYDFGVREAVAKVVHVAGPGASLIGDAMGVLAYYVRASGRTDLRVLPLSQVGLGPSGERWVFVQECHRSFENEPLIDQLRRSEEPWHEVRVRGASLLDVYRLPDAYVQGQP